MEFCNILRQLRESHGYTQKDLAKKLGISASAVGLYEQGRRKPNNNILKSLSEIFEESIDSLLGLTNNFNTQIIPYDNLNPKIYEIIEVLNNGNISDDVIDYIYNSLQLYKK